MRFSHDDLLAYVSGEKLDPVLRQFISAEANNETSEVAKWLREFYEKCNDPLSVDWLQLALLDDEEISDATKTTNREALRRTARALTLPERLKSVVGFIPKKLLHAAADAMADSFYFRTAAQFQAMQCSIGCSFGVEAIRSQLALISYWDLANRPEVAESAIFDLVSPETYLLAEKFLVAMTEEELNESQTLVCAAISQHFAGKRDLASAEAALELTAQFRAERELPDAVLCNHLNTQAALQVFKDDLTMAEHGFQEAGEFGKAHLGSDSPVSAITSLNLATVRTRLGMDPGSLREGALSVLRDHYPSLKQEDIADKLPVRMECCRGIALVV